MIIKLTGIEGGTILVNTEIIKFVVPYSTRGHIDASIVDFGEDSHIRVSESPEMILKLIERSENGKS
jgi:hypothetical protein